MKHPTIMRIQAGDIRVGHVIEYEGRMWSVLKAVHVKPGKGGAFVQVGMKEIQDSTNKDVRFRSEESVDLAYITEIDFAFLYEKGGSYAFMNQENYEEVIVSKNIVNNPEFLEDNMLVKIRYCNDEIIGVQLPTNVVCEVEETQPVIKGQTASSSYKPAVLKNKREILVPQHIDSGDKIVVNTADCTYVSRSK